ncbi:MAG TPA: DnaJ domain-containing protein [Thermoanaerobaculia bacterium]|nr:DnaJ domain-containing protein [Thermoanaerobaculia bacterium]
MAKSYYDILGLPQNATEEQIRSRFRELARVRHPDRFQGAEKDRAEREFQELTEALNLLTNPDKRRIHDADLARPVAQKQDADPGQLARVYLQRGVKAYKDQNYLEAAENFDRATKAQAGNSRAWYNLALACSHQRRWLSRATTAIARACELEPMNPTYLKLAGRLFETAGMAARAEQYYEDSLQWGGSDPTVEQKLDELRRAKKGRPGLFG